MQAAILKSLRKIEVEDYPLRSLTKDELLIKVSCCGICGTDHHIFDGKAYSSIPVIMGHEFAGIVEDVNGYDSQIKAGDKVAIDPNIYCGYCNYCRRGKINFCENYKALGVSVNGGFAEYSIVPVSQVYQLPPEFDMSVAAFAEPVSCCLRGIEHANIKPGESVIIVGGGTIGLIMVQLAKIAGASKIILVEPYLFKQVIALESGADFAISPYDENFIDIINSFIDNSPDVIIECVGKKQSVELSLKLTGKGTRVIIFGLAPQDHNIEINIQHLFKNEIKIFSSFLNPYTFKPAVDLLVSGRINVKKLISNQVSLNNISKILSGNNGSQFIKQQII